MQSDTAKSTRESLLSRKEDLGHGIDEITKELKKPGIPFVERMMLHADRKDMRKEFAKIEFLIIEQDGQ